MDYPDFKDFQNGDVLEGDELDGNFSIVSGGAEFNPALDVTSQAIYIPGQNLSAGGTGVYQSQDLPLNPNIRYYVYVDVKPSQTGINATLFDGDTTADINGFKQGNIDVEGSSGSGNNHSYDLYITDGSNQVTVVSGGGSSSIESKRYEGSYIHKEQDYLFINGYLEDKIEDTNNDSPEDTYKPASLTVSLSSLNTPYRWGLTETQGEANIEMTSISSTNNPAITREYSTDGGSTWTEFSKNGVTLSGDSNVRVRVSSSGSVDVNGVILKPLT